MTPLETARKRVLILREVLRLTPASQEDRIDVQKLQTLLDAREGLLKSLPAKETPSPDDLKNMEYQSLCTEAENIGNEINKRDQDTLSKLGDSRGKIAQVLHKAEKSSYSTGTSLRRIA